MNLYDKLFTPRVFTLPNGKQICKRRSRAPFAVLILLAMTALSVRVTGFSLTVLISRIREFCNLGRYDPTLNEELYAPDMAALLFDTIKMSLFGFGHRTILVVPFAMLASTNIIHNRIVVGAMRLLLSIIRTLPTLVSALIATYVFGLGTLAGTTAIAIFTFAYIGKILYEEIETVDMGHLRQWKLWGHQGTCLYQLNRSPGIALLSSNCLFCFEGNSALCLHFGLCRRGRTWTDP